MTLRELVRDMMREGMTLYGIIGDINQRTARYFFEIQEEVGFDYKPKRSLGIKEE